MSAMTFSTGKAEARLLRLPPARALFDQPAEQRFFESDIHSCLFAFEPLVAEDLVALAGECPVEKRRFHKLKVVVLFEHKHWGVEC